MKASTGFRGNYRLLPPFASRDSGDARAPAFDAFFLFRFDAKTSGGQDPGATAIARPAPAIAVQLQNLDMLRQPIEKRAGETLAFPSKRGIYQAMKFEALKFETPCACSTLRRAARAVTAAYDAALAPSGLRITQFSILRKLARLGPLPVTRLAAEAALDRSTMGRNLNPLERRGLVRIEVGNVDQRERVAHLTAAGEAAIEAALPHWRKAQERIAALVQPSAIGELADQLDALGTREQNPA